MPTQPATARGRATRQALLAAAEEVFGEASYAGAAITEITRRAGVAQGTFYVYFTHKKAIFLELVEHLGSELRATLTRAVDGAEGRLAVEEAGLRAFLAFTRKHQNLYRIVRQAEFIDEEAYKTYYRRFAEGYRTGLAQCVAAGEVAPVDLEALSFALMGISDFIGMRWVLWAPDEPVPEAVIEAVMHLLRHGIGPQHAEDA